MPRGNFFSIHFYAVYIFVFSLFIRFFVARHTDVLLYEYYSAKHFLAQMFCSGLTLQFNASFISYIRLLSYL